VWIFCINIQKIPIIGASAETSFPWSLQGIKIHFREFLYGFMGEAQQTPCALTNGAWKLFPSGRGIINPFAPNRLIEGLKPFRLKNLSFRRFSLFPAGG
jgi:hypothetical protein